MEVKANKRIKDYKGRKYTIIAQGYHTELKEFQVVYRDDDGATLISPLSKFSTDFKNNNGEWVPYFEDLQD